MSAETRFGINNTPVFKVTAKTAAGVETPATAVTAQVLNGSTVVVAEHSILASLEGTATYAYQYTFTTAGTYNVMLKYTIGDYVREKVFRCVVVSRDEAGQKGY